MSSSDSFVSIRRPARIPVVFYTAHYGEREARALALSSGVSYVLTKPAESAEVLKIVGRVLSGESETAVPPDASPLTTEFDREHLRLLTDKLSEKAGGPENRQRAIESADQYRVGARVRAGLRPAASERVRGRARPVWRDVRHARHRRSERPDGATCRHLWNGRDLWRWRCQLDRDRRRCPGDPRHGRRRATDGAWRQSWWRSGQTAAARCSTRKSRHFSPRPSRHRPTSTAGSVSSATRARTFTEDDEHLVMALSGQVGRIYEKLASLPPR